MTVIIVKSILNKEVDHTYILMVINLYRTEPNPQQYIYKLLNHLDWSQIY